MVQRTEVVVGEILAVVGGQCCQERFLRLFEPTQAARQVADVVERHHIGRIKLQGR